MGLGAGLGGGRGALGFQHARVGEYEAGRVGRGGRGGRPHHRRVQAVSICAIHASADDASAQADGLDDGALGLVHMVVRLLLHYHVIVMSPGAHVGAHGQREGGALLVMRVLLMPRRRVAIVDGDLAHGVVGDQHELQLVLLLLQALDLLLQVGFLLLQLLSLLRGEEDIWFSIHSNVYFLFSVGNFLVVYSIGQDFSIGDPL